MNTHNDNDNINSNPSEPITMDFEARLTAYALGELEEADAREIEQRLETDDAARATLESLRGTAVTLSQHFQQGEAPTLTDAQRESVNTGSAGASVSEPSYAGNGNHSSVIFTFARVGGGLAAAAALALTAVAGWWFFAPDQETGNSSVATEKNGLSEGAAVTSRDHAIDASTRSLPLERMPAAGADTSTSVDSPMKQAQALAKLGGPTSPPPPSAAGYRNDERLRAELYYVAPSDQLAVAGGDFQPNAEAKQSRVHVFEAEDDQMAAADEPREFNREEYNRIVDNPFIIPRGESALSTFSIDVDTASYANVRRYLNSGALPPPDAVRIEELVNYFNYDYKAPTESEAHPFSVDVAAMPAPWKPDHRLVRIGLKGREIDMHTRPATNLVFLLDVSGSMNRPDKLPLLKQSFKMLIDNLHGDDRVAIVVYAGASGLVLPSTYCTEKDKIMAAIDRLQAGGSTNGGAGIELAYKIATENFIDGGVNRVILATDGDFNVGVSSEADLVRLIEDERKSGVYLSVLGFGTGNYQDAKMEELSNKGNGNAAYIDSEREARKALVEQMSGTLVTIAKDVKIQVEFNPAHVQAYRLIGYENRMLAAEDFNDDTKDAGEIGAGLTVTALYEVVPPGVDMNLPSVDPLKYQSNENDAEQEAATADAEPSPEMLTVKLRYKTPETPEGGQSIYLDKPFVDPGMSMNEASADLKFASAVAGTGMILRRSPYRGDATLDVLLDLAEQAAGEDTGGYRGEFIMMMRKASELLPSELTISSSADEPRETPTAESERPADAKNNPSGDAVKPMSSTSGNGGGGGH